jgi:hypothetical protein
MKVIIEMSTEHYDPFLALCDLACWPRLHSVNPAHVTSRASADDEFKRCIATLISMTYIRRYITHPLRDHSGCSIKDIGDLDGPQSLSILRSDRLLCLLTCARCVKCQISDRHKRAGNDINRTGRAAPQFGFVFLTSRFGQQCRSVIFHANLGTLTNG